MLLIQKSPSLPQNLVFKTFCKLLIVFSTKVNVRYGIPSLFNGPEVLSSASDKANLFAQNFPNNPNLDDSFISLTVFHSRTNLKLINISRTPKMIKTVITNLDSSKACGLNVFQRWF